MCSTVAMLSPSTVMVVSVPEGGEAQWGLPHLHCCPNNVRGFLLCWGHSHLSSFPLRQLVYSTRHPGSHMVAYAEKIFQTNYLENMKFYSIVRGRCTYLSAFNLSTWKPCGNFVVKL